MKTLKIEKEVTKEVVYVAAESVEDSVEIRAILESAGEVVDESSPYSPQNAYLMLDCANNNWFYRWRPSGHRITIPQLAELLGVEYPLKKETLVGKWYKFNQEGCLVFKAGEDGLGYGWWRGRWDRSWSVPDNLERGDGWSEATPEEVERALIAEAKRRYKSGDMLSKIAQDHAPDVDGRVYPQNPTFKYDDRLWINKAYFYCIFADGRWAEVIEQKQLPTLEELIAEAKSKITVKSESHICWIDGIVETKSYQIEGLRYTSEKRAVAAYISKKIQEEYL